MLQVTGRTHEATMAALRTYLGIKERGSTACSTANTTRVLETKEEAVLMIEVPAAAAAPSAAGDQGARRSRRRAEVEGGTEAGGREEGSRKRSRKCSAVIGLQV